MLLHVCAFLGIFTRSSSNEDVVMMMMMMMVVMMGMDGVEAADVATGRHRQTNRQTDKEQDAESDINQVVVRVSVCWKAVEARLWWRHG